MSGQQSTNVGEPASSRGRPNFVFFVADDMGKYDLGCEGSTFYETPNIDRLASQSCRFANAYSACQVCSPSRVAIQTGRYPTRVPITDYIHFGGANQPENWRHNTRLLPPSFEMQGARYPTPNPRYDAVAAARSLEQVRNVRMAQREAEHAALYDRNFVPRGGWWQDRAGK